MECFEEQSPVRTSPISPPERDLLLYLIKEAKVLHNKKTDGRASLLKREAWARITRNFNAHNQGPNRTEKQLRKVWERLKEK